MEMEKWFKSFEKCQKPKNAKNTKKRQISPKKYRKRSKTDHFFLQRASLCYASIDTTSRHRKILNILIENEYTKEQVKKSISLLELVKKGPPDPNELPLEPGNTTSYSDYALDLIKAEADVNLVDRKTGKTVLMFACENKDERVTRALLRNGALPNPIEFFEKCSAAHIAAKSGSVDCLQALSAYSADFTVLNKRHESALHVAATVGFFILDR